MSNGEAVIGYLRVSTEEQGSSGAGLQAQRSAIQAECSRREWTLVRVEEDVLSGRTLKRPGLQAALEACRGRDVTGIVVAKLDRLSRSLIDFARLLEDAKRHGYNVVALDLGVDLSTPHGEFLANVMASAAQWERRIIGERTREALAVKRAQGVRVGRPLALDAAVAARIRRERSEGRSYGAIAGALNREAVPTAHGGRCWYPATVRGVARRIA